MDAQVFGHSHEMLFAKDYKQHLACLAVLRVGQDDIFKLILRLSNPCLAHACLEHVLKQDTLHENNSALSVLCSCVYDILVKEGLNHCLSSSPEYNQTSLLNVARQYWKFFSCNMIQDMIQRGNMEELRCMLPCRRFVLTPSQVELAIQKCIRPDLECLQDLLRACEKTDEELRHLLVVFSNRFPDVDCSLLKNDATITSHMDSLQQALKCKSARDAVEFLVHHHVEFTPEEWQQTLALSPTADEFHDMLGLVVARNTSFDQRPEPMTGVQAEQETSFLGLQEATTNLLFFTNQLDSSIRKGCSDGNDTKLYLLWACWQFCAEQSRMDCLHIFASQLGMSSLLAKTFWRKTLDSTRSTPLAWLMQHAPEMATDLLSMYKTLGNLN